MLTGSLASAVEHMGYIDTDILDRMVLRGPQYLHAASTYESNVIKYNKANPQLAPNGFVFVYPSDCTFWLDHPFCIVDGVAWTSTDQKAAAQVFQDFLTQDAQQAQLVQYGLRRLKANGDSLTLDPASPFTQANGVLATATIETIPLLPTPTEAVLASVLLMWQSVKKPATIGFIVDRSGSMSGEPMTSVQTSALSFFQQMNDPDEVMIYSFSTSSTMDLTGYVSAVRSQFSGVTSGWYASGSTLLYDTVGQVVDVVNARQAAHLSAGDRRRNYAIVLMTDGADTASTVYKSDTALIAHLPDGLESSELHIFTIAFGSEPNKAVLQSIAARTNGKSFEATSSNINTIYQQIGMEF
jgi:uncharacterized protein YegL